MADMFRPVPVDQEPLLQSRFALEFPNELGIDQFIVQTAKKPSLNINAIEIPYMNSSNWVAGRAVWQQMEITFIDVIGPSTTQKIMEWVNLHYETSTGRSGYAVGYKKNLVLKALDGPGVEVQKWTLIGCQIVTADFDQFDYGADEVVKISITIQPDRCILSN
jgi:hypothetical protein